MTFPPADSPDSRHLRGFVLLAGGQACARALTFVALAALARVLGVEMFGVLGFAMGVAAYFLSVIDAGLDLIAMREIARREAAVERIVTTVVVVRLGLAVAAAALLWIIAPWLTNSATTLVVLRASGLTFFSFAVNLKWGLQALSRNGWVAVAFVLSQCVYLGSVLFCIGRPEDVLRVPVLLCGAELFGAGLLLLAYRRQGFRVWGPLSLPYVWTLLREVFPLAGAQAVRTLSLNFDLFLLGLVGDPQAVGLYAADLRVIMLLREFGALYAIPLLPALSQATQESTGRFLDTGRLAIRYAAVIIFPLAVGGCLTGPRLLATLFGSAYAPGAQALGWLLIAMIFAMLAGIYRMALIAANRQRTFFWIMAVGAVVNVGMNCVLIPRYTLVGGALSALAAEAVVFCLAWRAVAVLSPWRAVVLPAGAAGGMAVVLRVLPDVSLPITIGIGAASYAVFIFLFGAVRLRELQNVWHRQSSSVGNVEGVNQVEELP